MRKTIIAVLASICLMFISSDAFAQTDGSSFKPAFDFLVGGQSSSADNEMRPVWGPGGHVSLVGNENNIRWGVGIMAGGAKGQKMGSTKNRGTLILTFPFSIKLGDDDDSTGFYLTLAPAGHYLLTVPRTCIHFWSASLWGPSNFFSHTPHFGEFFN